MRNFSAVLLLLAPLSLWAQSSIEYDISFNNAVHHEAQITVTWHDIGNDPLEIRMSRSSPGRYATHEFAKNVYQVRAVDGQGNPLDITRSDPSQWDVAGHDDTVVATYTLYADRAGGTYSGIDLTHAHLNMPATFMWARGFEESPIEVTFRPSDDNWKVATQLPSTSNPYVFTAPNLQYFMDSPTELSNFSERSWQVSSSNGQSQTIRLVVHHDGNEEDVDIYLAKAKNIVNAHESIFGEFPEFDYGTYTFIADYLPYVSRDGMEHRNSTILANTESLNQADFSQIGTLSHEFFHAWNAERIRPSRLEPFNFEQANMSFNLWFMEGFTNYYGPLAIRRALESSISDYMSSISGTINTVSFSPGRSFASPQGMSVQAPFVDAATSIDPNNFSNTFISYYTYGSAVALALDLTLRDRFDTVTLDTFMQLVWQEHGKTELPYTTENLRDLLAEVTDDEVFANNFFSNYVIGQELPDYESLLANAGLLLRKANGETASLGQVNLAFEGTAAHIESNTIIGSPLYIAGLDRGDQILNIDRLKIESQEQWGNAISRYEPGDTATISYLQRGIARSAEITFIEDFELEVVTYETANMEISSEQLTFRRSWLGPELSSEN
ncbi:M61 family peptidase [Gammaproteobacteria bacterium]|nr:M61 family peptidase [Gammaproteobacteria bacterium]